MLCSSCRRTLLTRLRTPSSSSTSSSLHLAPPSISIQSPRTIATVPTPSPSSPPANPPKTTTSPAATSQPGHAQPFSNPFFPSKATAQANPKKPSKLTSSMTAGTAMPALAYTKASSSKPPVALEDAEYPPWLWTLLDPSRPKSTSSSSADPTNTEVDGLSQADLAAMSAKKRAKLERKQAKLMEGREKPVPIHEQSKNLTREGDGAGDFLRQREAVTRSARGARRSGIREDNFLRAM